MRKKYDSKIKNNTIKKTGTFWLNIMRMQLMMKNIYLYSLHKKNYLKISI